MLTGYDIIGDIHGQHQALEKLLAKMGYQFQTGVWRYPGDSRQAIFVGDFIDGNPGGLAVVNTLRRMVNTGSAQAVIGNHEFNAVAYVTPDPSQPGDYLRAHNAKNTQSHGVFLTEADTDPAAYDAAIAWFKSLPLWLDLGGIRIIHATWEPAHQAQLTPHMKPGNRLNNRILYSASTTGTPEYEAIECLLKGLESPLPNGIHFTDQNGKIRHKARLKWWLGEAPNQLKDAVIGPPSLIDQLDGLKWTATWPCAGYPANAPPLFCGHYWLSGTPALQAPNVACVDYSAARQEGQLVAYHWNGEARLSHANFVAVDV